MVGLAQRFGGISYFLSYGAPDLPDSGHTFNRAQCMAFFGIGSLISNILSGFLLDIIGRKPILLFSTISTSICMFVGALYFIFQPIPVDTRYYPIPYSIVITFSLVFTAGLGVIPATFQGELFPAEIKQHASAIVVMALSLGSFLVNITHDRITDFAGVAGNYLVAAGCSLFFSIFTCVYVFETKGKTLIEIQETLSRSASRTSIVSASPGQATLNKKDEPEDKSNSKTAPSETDFCSWQDFGIKGNGSANDPEPPKSINRTTSEIFNHSPKCKNKFYLRTFKSMSANDLKIVQETV